MKIIDLKIETGEFTPAGCIEPIEGVFFTHPDGERLFLSKRSDLEPLYTARKGSQTITTNGVEKREPCLVCDRKRDFGGCGKDAAKLETDVPFSMYLIEQNAYHVAFGGQYAAWLWERPPSGY